MSVEACGVDFLSIGGQVHWQVIVDDEANILAFNGAVEHGRKYADLFVLIEGGFELEGGLRR